MAERVLALRGDAPGEFEVVVDNPPGTDLAPWIDAGATWCLTGFGTQPDRVVVERAIDSLEAG